MVRISRQAKIGLGCEIADTAIIYSNVELDDGCKIGEFCIIGHPARGQSAGRTLKIGAGSHIRSHTTVYEGSTFGPRLMVGHGCMVREGIKAGRNLQIGSMNDLEGDATFGDWVRFHSNVHICRGTSLGDLVWIFPYVVTTNDPAPPSGLQLGPTLDHGTVVCTQSIVLPETTMGIGAFAGAMTRASGTIPAGALVVGNPCKLVGTVRKVKYPANNYNHPWMTHHGWYYPDEAQDRIREVGAMVEAACDALEKELSIKA
jgi:acetyltransferase-like isoleucine patch superfamily enzyme